MTKVPQGTAGNSLGLLSTTEKLRSSQCITEKLMWKSGFTGGTVGLQPVPDHPSVTPELCS